MSQDGADLGVKAERAMKAVIGGDQPTEDDMMDPVAFEAYIMSAPDKPATYDDGARRAAKYILEHFRAHPEDTRIPTETQYLEDENGRPVFRDGNLVPTDERSLSEAMFATPGFRDLDLTGFMWGWAVNAARRCLELEPVPNPAILTIEVKGDA